MFKTNTTRAISFLVVAIAFAATVLFSTSLFAAPKVSWVPQNVSEVVSAGDTEPVSVSLISNRDLVDASIHVVPELAPYISVDPNTIDLLEAGELLNVNLSITVPAMELPGALDGVLQVRGESNGRTLSKPLPVDIEVVWEQATNEDLGVTLEYPDFGEESEVVFTEITDDMGVLEILVQSSDLISQIILSFTDNPAAMSLSEWFAAHVDLGGFLFATSAFVPEILPNGLESLILVGPIPPDHGNDYGPVSFLYAISPDGSKFISANFSHGNELGLLGLVTEEQQLEYLINIVSSLSFE